MQISFRIIQIRTSLCCIRLSACKKNSSIHINPRKLLEKMFFLDGSIRVCVQKPCLAYTSVQVPEQAWVVLVKLESCNAVSAVM